MYGSSLAPGAQAPACMQAPEEGKFLKGLSVVDDVAYFGIAASAPRSARHDPALDCELAAFDLLQRTLLWRSQACLHALEDIAYANFSEFLGNLVCPG